MFGFLFVCLEKLLEVLRLLLEISRWFWSKVCRYVDGSLLLLVHDDIDGASRGVYNALSELFGFYVETVSYITTGGRGTMGFLLFGHTC